MKSGLCQPLQDDNSPRSKSVESNSAGSSHAGVINVLYADGSVHSVNYEVNLETWNNMVHRADGEVINR
jgi:prepilin-type processing-associated H-X9-DG protein